MAQGGGSFTITFKGMDQGAVRTANAVATELSRVNSTTNMMAQQVTGASQATMGFTNMLNRAQKGVMWLSNQGLNAANSIRLVSQGMMSVGKSLSLFVTPVIALFFKNAYQAATQFDAQLVRVQKTTGLTTEAMNILGRGLRDMAMNTSTGAIELAEISEQLGQMGITSVPEILRLVDILNMLSMATDIAADEVGLAVGRLANAFAIDLNTEEGVEEIRRLMNVINQLENTTASKAPEILKAMENFAQAGAILDFPPEIGAAFVATLISVGFSADEAGTALRNMTLKITQNRDAISQLMGATDKYDTVLELTTALNEDFAGTLVDIVRAAADSDDRVEALASTFEALGIRGGKALAAFAGAPQELADNLVTAVQEMDRATSLQIEYERQLLSTENQMKMLKNQFTEFALVMGDTFLPIINTLVATAIPAVRRLIDAFAGLPDPMKKAIVAGALLLMVLGPILLFASQITFGFAMMGMSIFRAIQVISGFGFMAAKVAITLGGIVAKITGLGAGTLALALLIGGVVAAILIKITGMGDKIAAFFIRLGEAAEDWGANLIVTFGQGMLKAAASFISKVLTAIGNFIGRFLAGSSPPELGPLSHIDLWGKNVFDAFLEGFANADFSILKDVGRTIEKVLSTMAKVSKIGEADEFVFAMKARKDLAKLISIFNETGNVAQDVLNDITANLGEASDEVQKLITLWLDYTSIQKELAELEQRRHGVLDTYRQEIQLIAQSTMTAEDKADAIRQAMRSRDEELKAIAEEEHALEDQNDIVQQQLDTQKSLIEAMQHQDDLQLRLLDTLDKLVGKLDEIGNFEFPEIEPFGIPDPDPDDKLGQLGEDFRTMSERIEAGKKAMEGFFTGLRGEEFDDTIFQELLDFDEEAGTTFADTYKTLHGYGMGIHDIWDKISGVWDTAKGFFEKIGEVDVKELSGNIGEIADALGIIAQVVGPVLAFVATLKTMAAIKEGGSIIGFLIKKLPRLAGIGATLGNIGAGIGRIVEAFAAGGLGGAASAIRALAGGISLAALAVPLLVAAIVAGVIWIIRNFDKVKAIPKNIVRIWKLEIILLKAIVKRVAQAIVDRFMKIKDGIGKAIDKVRETISDKWQAIVDFLMEKTEGIRDFLSEKWEEIKEFFGGLFEGLLAIVQESALFQFIEQAWTSIKENVMAIWQTIVDEFGPIWVQIVEIAQTVWERIKEAIANAWESIKETISTAWENIKTWISTQWEAFKTTVSEIWNSIVSTIVGVWDTIIGFISPIWEGIKTWIGERWDAFKTFVTEKWEAIRDAVILAITPLLTKLIIFWFRVKNTIAQKWEQIKTMIGEKVTAVKDKILEFRNQFVEAGKNLIKGVIDGIGSMVQDAIRAAADLAQAALDTIKRILKMTSPSQVMMDVGVNFVEGMVLGIDSMGQSLADQVGNTLTEGMMGGASMFSPPSLGIGSPLAPDAEGGEQQQIVMHFGKDSVRSDRDIEEIASQVERVLQRRVEGTMGVGGGFQQEGI